MRDNPVVIGTGVHVEGLEVHSSALVRRLWRSPLSACRPTTRGLRFSADNGTISEAHC